MPENIFYHDLHVHTNLSRCAPETTAVRSYFPLVKSEGVEVLGYVNHIYYDKNSAKRAMGIVEELKNVKEKLPCRILLGAEVETIYHKPPNLSFEDAKGFDYVLLSPSHFFNQHMQYSGYDFSTDQKVRDIAIKNFLRACKTEYPVPTGIAHPLYPVSAREREEDIVKSYTDSMLYDCFSTAKKYDKSIEIHACLYRKWTKLNEKGLSYVYLNILSAAKACGCKFHFGSDAHKPETFEGVHKKLYTAAEILGLSEGDIWNIGKR